MRFKRRDKSPYEVTERKKAAFRRKLKKEQEAMPLFADQLAEIQPDVEDEMAQRVVRAKRSDQVHRDFQAKCWRKARAEIYSQPPEIKDKLLHYWNNHRWFPGGALHLCGMLDIWRRGELDLDSTLALNTKD